MDPVSRRRKGAAAALAAPVEAVTDAVGAAASDGRLLNPWLIWVGSPVLPTVSYEVFGPNPAMGVLWTAAASGVTAASWAFGSARSPKARWLSTITTGTAGLWTASAAIVAPWNPVTGATWLVAGASLALTWNIKHGQRNQGGARGAGDGLAEVIAKAVAAGTTVDNVAIGPNRIEIATTLPRGEMQAADAVEAGGRLASLAGLPKGQVRVLPSSTDNGKATFIIVTADALKTPPAYGGPSAPGTTLLVPLRVGTYEDGTPELLYLMSGGKGSNIVHWLIFGMPGAGKTGGGRAALAEIVTRTEVVLWGVDVTKAGQGIGPFEEAFDWLITGEDAEDMDEAEEMANVMFDCLENVVAARTRFLAAKGLDGWKPGCGLPVLIVWVEEAARLLEDAKAFTRFVNAARSAGVIVVVSLQRPTTDGIPGTLRAALGGLWSFGLNTDDDATRFLGPELVEQGVHPDAWKARYPGRNYLIGPDIAEELHITPAMAEGYFSDPDEGPTRIREHVAAYAHLRVALDETTYNEAPAAYREYRAKRAARAGRPAAAPAAASTATLTAPRPAPAPALEREEMSELEREMSKLPAEVRQALAAAMPQLVAEDDDEAEVLEMASAILDADAELPEAGGLSGTVEITEYEELSKEEAEVLLRVALADQWDKGRTKLKTAQLIEIFAPTGRDRTTMYDYWNAFAKQGWMRKGKHRGEWEIVARPEIPEGVELVLA